MNIFRAASVSVLLLAVVIAYFGMIKQAEWNGTFSLASIFVYNEPLLPGTQIPVHLPRTGLAPLDNYLAFMLSFFMVVLDSKNAHAHVVANHIVGTLSSAWMLMLLEGHRYSSSRSFFLITYGLELGGELLGIGLFTPIWCIVHLLSTASPTKAAKKDLKPLLSVPRGHLSALGYAFIFGYIAPTILMLQCKPDTVGIFSQQIWTILRLFHPLMVLALFGLFVTITGTSTKRETALVSLDRRLSWTRSFYVFAILASGFFHSSLVGTVLLRFRAPHWFQRDVLEALTPTSLLPPPFWTAGSTGIVPLVTGVATFLQWDDTMAGVSILIWASFLYLEASSIYKHERVARTFLLNVLVAILAGPAAAASFLMLERDNVLLASLEQGNEKEQ